MEGSKLTQHLERARSIAPRENPDPTVDQRIELAITADQAHESARFDELTGGRLQPRFAYTGRFAGHLALGEVVIEPALGAARIAALEQHGETVAVRWTDDNGPTTATARYKTDDVFFVRAPGPRDRLAIQQQVDRATWHRNDIPGQTARLIAAHLHLGPWSVLYRFAINGGILDDRLYDELDTIKRNRPAFEPWVQTLTRYCLSRQDADPVPGWIPERPEPAVDQDSIDPPIPTTRATGGKRELMGRYVTRLTAEHLMDAAFDLGVVAARSGLSRTALGRHARIRAATGQRRRSSRGTP